MGARRNYVWCLAIVIVMRLAGAEVRRGEISKLSYREMGKSHSEGIIFVREVNTYRHHGKASNTYIDYLLFYPRRQHAK